MDKRLSKLEELLKPLYARSRRTLLFHGWHHIQFVKKKALGFSKELKADPYLVQIAALVHDLNYAVSKNSHPKAGAILRKKYLTAAGFSRGEVDLVERIVLEEHTASRHGNISKEAKALSDADTLFKSLPITPILFASAYLKENKVDIEELSRKICREQKPLLEKGLYFYTKIARRKYLGWAKTNLKLWSSVEACLEDKDARNLLNTAYKNGVLD